MKPLIAACLVACTAAISAPASASDCPVVPKDSAAELLLRPASADAHCRVLAGSEGLNVVAFAVTSDPPAAYALRLLHLQDGKLNPLSIHPASPDGMVVTSLNPAGRALALSLVLDAAAGARRTARLQYTVADNNGFVVVHIDGGSDAR